MPTYRGLSAVSRDLLDGADKPRHVGAVEQMSTDPSVRAHWLIENGLHWTLDVVFNEDNSRVRKDNAGENMAIIRHITLNMLNNAKKSFKNVALKALRKKAGWGNETLAFI